ncbi:MAG: chitobiase/beta-hexosaminidase C-terminal domain-containing protein [Muribaculaceae bacterium]|nr:chitobiase/beta-hexosaminidase C-terminal domain-containing protein [Muribaculaceae bacterium]
MKKKLLLLAVAILPFLSQAQGWPDNYGGVMMQAFSWNSFGDTRWVKLTEQSDEISQYFNLIWIPQSGWTGSGGSMGYDVKYYFNQKSAFGTATELRELISTYKNKGTGVIADVVVNHRGTLTNWVDFPVETYNGVTYQMTPADICKNDDGGATATWLAQQQALGNIPASVTLSTNNDEGEDWGGMRDLDHKSENVRNVIKAYVSFLANDLGYTGFRYDMTRGFWANRVAEYNATAGVQFSVGENWSSQSEIQTWIDNCKWNGVNMSASFDFPFRYTVRDVVRGYRDGSTAKVTWKDLTIGGLMSTTNFKRYAVTFVENHDTQYRDENNQNDPIRADTLAANAYLLTMPGTPCVFLPHWKDYKQEIKNMIDIRKTVGVTNTSTAQKYPLSKSYEMSGFKSSGANGKSMYCVVGKNKYLKDNVIAQYYATILEEAVEVTKGWGYRLYMSKNCETAWCDKASGKYKAAFDARLTAVTATSGAQLVYTLDGSTPTASSPKVASNGTVHITQPCTLTVGLLKGSAVSGIVTRNYDFAGQGQPRTINIYVNVDEVGWNPVRFYTWDQDDQQHNGNWPGEVITQKVSVGGKIWYTKQYTLANDDCYMNFVFNTGASGAPQTVDVRYSNTDKFFTISANLDPDENKNMVNDVTEDYAGLPVTPVTAIPGDVNGDGLVSSVDITALYNYLLNGDSSAIVNGDQDGDGIISSVDVTIIYNILLGSE